MNRIYWFSFFNEDSPSVRYRAKYPLKYFSEEHNVHSMFIFPNYSIKMIVLFFVGFFKALFSNSKQGVIVIQRVSSSFFYSSCLKLLVLCKSNTVYDLDDADYLCLNSKSIYFFAKNVGVISAGSREIKEHLKSFNKNIILTPSPVPERLFFKTSKNDDFTIGWVGDFDGDHKKALWSLVFPAIKQLNFQCTLFIAGVKNETDKAEIDSFFRDNELIKVEAPLTINWRNEKEVQKILSSFDIGVATLLDNPIQRSKSGIKAKQCMNSGIPVLGTNLPENDWVIKDGINGFYCQESKDYFERINQFYKMDDIEYARFSLAAINSCESFNHEHYYQRFKEIQLILQDQ